MGDKRKKGQGPYTISGRFSGPTQPALQNLPYSNDPLDKILRRIWAEQDRGKWLYEDAVKVFNEHCPQVCAMFQGKFSTQTEYNAAYEAEMNKRLAHTGWTEAQIVSVIYNRAAVEMDAYYAPMRSKL